MTTNPWWRAPLLGAVLGLPILGGGGRLAMRMIASLTDAPSVISFEGTLTVLLAGLASGIGGGALYAVLAWALPRWRAARAVLFAAGLCFLTLRGLHPVRPLSFALFAPLVVVYGGLLEWLWHRQAASRRVIEVAV